jgi:hypothetical protein
MFENNKLLPDLALIIRIITFKIRRLRYQNVYFCLQSS